MIFSHLNYCFTSWSQASQSAKRPLETLYKQAIKIMDKKPRHYHHCAILKKHSLLNWNSIHKFLNLNLIYKDTHYLAPARPGQWGALLNGILYLRRLDSSTLIRPLQKNWKFGSLTIMSANIKSRAYWAVLYIWYTIAFLKMCFLCVWLL